MTSPIIAAYGMIPVILFNSIGLWHLIVSFISLSTGILLFWLFNIYLVNLNISSVKRYISSYLATSLLHTGTIYIMITSSGKMNPLNFLIYSVVATWAVNTIILVIINAELLKTKKNKAETEYQKLKVMNLEAQKKVLIQQLQPHFLFNALSTLKSLIREDQEQAEEYSVKLSEFLRYSINFQSNELVTLKEELRFSLDYIELQKVRFGDALICEIQIPEEITNCKLPAFALQTLIENAIKHNSFTEKKPLNIKITAVNSRIRISNNKSPKPLLQASGTGLANLNERYKITSNYSIEVVNNDNDFTVYLNLIEK